MSDSSSRKGTPQMQSSRRKFLAGSSTALAGSALAPALSIAQSAHAAGSDRVKIGLIGCGGRGGGAVRSALAVNPAASLTAMADAFADRITLAREAMAASLGGQIDVKDGHCFDGFDGYRRLLDSGVDVVILAEPPGFRPRHIEACVKAGAHVFSEKPMAVDAPGVRKVLAAGEEARRKNLSFVSGFETRYSDAAREAVRRIQDGEIGDIVSIDSVYNTGPLWHRGRKPEWTEMEFQVRNWYYFTWLSGDHLVEQHVHYNDFVAWVMQDVPPLNAWGYGGRQVRTAPEYGDIFDHHAVVYEYPGGVRYHAYTRQQRGCYNENSRLILGTKGRLTALRNYAITDLKGNPVWESPKTVDKNPELTCFEEMFAAMREGTPINDSLSMARSTMSAILGRMATHSGKLVTWDEAWASEVDLSPKDYSWDADPPAQPGVGGHYPEVIPGVTKAF